MLWHTPGFVTSSAPSSLGAQPGECPRLLRGSQHCFPPPSLSSACSQHGDPALLGGLGCSELPGGVCALRSCPSSAAVLVQITHMLWGNREVPSQGSVGWVCSLCLGLGDAPVVKTQKGSTVVNLFHQGISGKDPALDPSLSRSPSPLQHFPLRCPLSAFPQWATGNAWWQQMWKEGKILHSCFTEGLCQTGAGQRSGEAALVCAWSGRNIYDWPTCNPGHPG